MFPLKNLNLTLYTAKTPKAIAYCHKDGDYVEYGELQQGRRTDLDAARYMAHTDGMRNVTALLKNNQVLSAEKYLTYGEIGRDSAVPVVVRWFWGPPGSGKTRAVYADIERDGGDAWSKNGGGKWFQGYDGHDILILDDIRSDWFPLTFLLKLIDRYPMMVENKGGSRQMKATTVYVTSVMHPRDLYNLAHEPVQQLLRRIYTTTQFTMPDGRGHAVILNPIQGVPEEAVPEVGK